MKRGILLVGFLICWFYGASQSLFGVRSGINVSNLDFNEDPTVKTCIEMAFL